MKSVNKFCADVITIHVPSFECTFIKFALIFIKTIYSYAFLSYGWSSKFFHWLLIIYSTKSFKESKDWKV